MIEGERGQGQGSQAPGPSIVKRATCLAAAQFSRSAHAIPDRLITTTWFGNPYSRRPHADSPLRRTIAQRLISREGLPCGYLFLVVPGPRQARAEHSVA